jgi:hypothetical protein
VSIYSRRGARVDYLSRKFASDDYHSGPDSYRPDAESLVQADEHQVGEVHGQRVRKIFHDADFIVNLDVLQNRRQMAELTGRTINSTTATTCEKSILISFARKNYSESW